MPLTFGPPSRDTQLAVISIVSRPFDRGGLTWPQVEVEVLEVSCPALENAAWRYSERLV